MGQSNIEQTAFRFDKNLLSLMKSRAKSQEKSLNSYITGLVIKDLLQTKMLPQIKFPQNLDPKVKKYSGILHSPSQEDLDKDERLERIWKR